MSENPASTAHDGSPQAPPEQPSQFPTPPVKRGRPSKPLGSRTTTNKGTVLIKIGHNLWVAEHRMIMEDHLKRKLTKDEDVKHINKIGADNRIENLYVVVNNVVTCHICAKVLNGNN